MIETHLRSLKDEEFVRRFYPSDVVDVWRILNDPRNRDKGVWFHYTPDACAHYVGRMRLAHEKDRARWRALQKYNETVDLKKPPKIPIYGAKNKQDIMPGDKDEAVRGIYDDKILKTGGL